MASVVSVSVSEKKGTVKHPVPEVQLIKGYGISGDAHAGNWHRQVSLLGRESLQRMQELFPQLGSGSFAENILTEGITLYTLPVGTLLRLGSVLLRVTQIGKQCHSECEIRRLTGDCVMPREGIFAEVLEGGTVRKGTEITVCQEY